MGCDLLAAFRASAWPSVCAMGRRPAWMLIVRISAFPCARVSGGRAALMLDPRAHGLTWRGLSDEPAHCWRVLLGVVPRGLFEPRSRGSCEVSQGGCAVGDRLSFRVVLFRVLPGDLRCGYFEARAGASRGRAPGVSRSCACVALSACAVNGSSQRDSSRGAFTTPTPACSTWRQLGGQARDNRGDGPRRDGGQGGSRNSGRSSPGPTGPPNFPARGFRGRGGQISGRWPGRTGRFPLFAAPRN